jgi:hypothetical protein
MEPNAELRNATLALADSLRHLPAVTSVGIGDENGRAVFLVYTSRELRKSEKQDVPAHWHNLPVLARKLGRVVPA